MIIESGIVTATTADLLAGGRLNSIPYRGMLTMQFLADLNNASNNWALTIQLPNGDVPIDDQAVPGSNPALGGVLDDRQLLQLSFNATAGGHFTISLTETGTAICTYRLILTP